MSLINSEPLKVTPLVQDFTIPDHDYRFNLFAVRPLLMLYNDPVGTFTFTLKDGADVLASFDFDMQYFKDNTDFLNNQFHYGFFKIPLKAVLNSYRTYTLELSSSGYTFDGTSYISWLKEFEDITNTFTDDTIWSYREKPFGYQLWGHTMSRVLNFNDSFSSATLPIIEGTVAYGQFSSTAEYESEVGLPQGGSVFYNTTLGVIQYYDDVTASWIVQAQAGQVQGTRGAPIAITAGGGITATQYQVETVYVEGSGGAVDITANPQISVGNNDGDELILIGTSDANTLQLDDGNGLSLNGAMLLVNNSVIRLQWDGTLWLETARRD